MMRHAWRNLTLCAAALAALLAGCSSWSSTSADPNSLGLYPWPGQQTPPLVHYPAQAAVAAAPVPTPQPIGPPSASAAPAGSPPVVRAQNGAYGGMPVQPVGPDARQPVQVAQAPAAPAGPYTSYQGAGVPATAAPAQVAPGGVPAQPASLLFPYDQQFQTETPPNSTDPFIDLDAYAQETQTGKFQIGAAVNSDAGLVGQIVLDEQNFDLFRWPSSWEDVRSGTAWRGAGQRFRLEAMPGTEVQRYVISFTEPYLFNSLFSLSTSGSYFDRVYTDWTEQRAGGRVALGYQFPEVPDLSTALAFRGERVRISNPIVPTPPELAAVLGPGGTPGDHDLFGFGVTVKHDTRDNAFLPTQGHVVELSGEWVTGSFQYPRATADARQYFTLLERPDGSGRHTLAVGGRVGFSGDDTPIYEHFFAGGFSTIRGFEFRGMGPFQDNVSVGGDFQMLGSIEYMFPITADDALRGVVFTDFGTVESDVRIDNFRASVGFGLRIVLAQALGPAPIALDFAVPVSHSPDDQIQNFSFFVGYSR